MEDIESEVASFYGQARLPVVGLGNIWLLAEEVPWRSLKHSG